MTRFQIALGLCVLASVSCALSPAQESTAKCRVTVRIPDSTPNFSGQRLVIILSHNFPGQEDRGDKAVDSIVDSKFAFQGDKGVDLTFNLGQKIQLKANVQYYLNVTVFTKDSRRIFYGQLDGEDGPFPVLTNGAPSKLIVTLKSAQ